ncbi:ATP-binding protein [Campylobacter sp. CCUG 57310]|uniref:ATP-binding protein n=1 Tax=Campylobacter sp. CCUG 57310 TaxID=2517362 RepID=UPI001563E9A2|nr:ATP-binding protein [Campylobacter sp. CCUG 57310]QKF93228.1 ATP-binding protein (AAA domain) [Campylobacter sp. CCUG 57310]
MLRTQEDNKIATDFIKKFCDDKLSFNDDFLGYVWIVAKDIIFYNYSDLISEYLKLDCSLYPTEEDIQTVLKTKRGIVFIAPYRLPEKYKEFFIEIRANNLYNVLTTQDYLANLNKAKVLQDRLGISVIDSPYKLSDVGGAERLKSYVEQLKVAEENGFKPKGIFLVGIPGTGKTFFPTCLAGELKRPLIMLNLEALKESGEPINRLNEVFEYLNSQNEKFILLIDEIEKMIGKADDPLTGRLMTILSALGDRGSEYKDLQIMIFATANDLNTIIDNQPALLRRGRFDELFFVNLPTAESAKDILRIYVKKFGLEILFDIFNIEDLIAEMESKYRSFVNQSNRFPYTPAEIESFLKRLAFIRLTKEELTRQDVFEAIDLIIPIVKSAEKSINRITAQKELFIEI